MPEYLPATLNQSPQRPRVLVTRTLPNGPLSRAQRTCDLVVHDGSTAMSHDELCARARGANAIISLLTDRIDAEVLNAAGPGLRIVANVAVGYDNLDTVAAAARNVWLTNTPDVLTDATADLTWALLLNVMRRVSEGERLVRQGAWTGWTFDALLGSDLRGRLLGIVGLGRIGSAVARRAAAFGMRVCYAAHRSTRSDVPREWTELTLERLLSDADVVSLHVPLTSRTRHLIDARALASMKPTAYLVNTSRGPVVDEAALAAAIRAGHLAGAALDVYEREPLVHPGLFGLEQVVLAPHLGSATVDTRTAMADLAVTNVLEVLAGRPPVTPIP